MSSLPICLLPIPSAAGPEKAHWAGQHGMPGMRIRPGPGMLEDDVARPLDGDSP